MSRSGPARRGRQGKASLVQVRKGMAGGDRLGLARTGREDMAWRAWHGLVSPVVAWCGRRGESWPGKASLGLAGTARRGTARFVLSRQARSVLAGRVAARRGSVWLGRLGLSRRVGVLLGVARQARPVMAKRVLQRQGSHGPFRRGEASLGLAGEAGQIRASPGEPWSGRQGAAWNVAARSVLVGQGRRAGAWRGVS